MRVISLTNASSVVDPGTGKTYEAADDGVFDLPHAFAVELVTRHASQWRGESAHEATLHAAQVQELRNPHVLPKVVADLRGRLEAAETKIEELGGAVADLTSRLAAFDTPAGAEQDDADGSDEDATEEDARNGDAEAKSTRPRKTAAKKTAAKLPAE